MRLIKPGPADLGLLLLVAAAVRVEGGTSLELFATTVHARSAFEAQLIRGAAIGARQRLLRAKCQRIFQEFQDAEGRPLQVSLDAARQTGAGYLEGLVFRSGAELQVCGRSVILAATHVGSRIIHICPAFTSSRLRNPRLTEVVLIHELLHSLGLREGGRFPSSNRITWRVLASCHER